MDRDRLAVEGQPIDPDQVDQRSLQDLQPIDNTGFLGKDHSGCRVLVLDLAHDPDARAVARVYASRVVHTRPNLSRDLRAATESELRPGERYVDPSEVRVAGQEMAGDA